MPHFRVVRIDHIVFRVADLERSINFYCTTLGCKVVRRREDLGLVHLRAGTSMIDLISVSGKLGLRGGKAASTEGRNVDHLCLRVEPFEEHKILEHLKANGLIPQGPATRNFGAEGEGLSLYFTDPDGNSIELKGPSEEQSGAA